MIRSLKYMSTKKALGILVQINMPLPLHLNDVHSLFSLSEDIELHYAFFGYKKSAVKFVDPAQSVYRVIFFAVHIKFGVLMP